MGRGEPQGRCLDPGRRKSRQRGEQTFCTASDERHPLNSDSCVVKLPGTGQFSHKGGARKAKGMGGATKRGKRLIPDVLDQLEGSRGKAAIHVQHERNKRAALLLRVDTILTNLVPLSLSHGFPRGHVHIGGGVRVHTRDIEVHRVYLAVGEKVGQILLHHVSIAVVAAGEAAKELAAAVMPPRDRLSLKLGAAQSVPW